MLWVAILYSTPKTLTFFASFFSTLLSHPWLIIVTPFPKFIKPVEVIWISTFRLDCFLQNHTLQNTTRLKLQRWFSYNLQVINKSLQVISKTVLFLFKTCQLYFKTCKKIASQVLKILKLVKLLDVKKVRNLLLHSD